MPKTEPKASERIVARVTLDLKTKLAAALDEHPHFKGNASAWINACAQSWIFQIRRGEKPAFPIEFLSEK